jgi:DNA-binding cell septation regulator SpoVG
MAAQLPEYISDIRFYKTDGRGAFEGSGSLTVANALAIKFTIFNTNGVMRLVLPNEKNPNFDDSRPGGRDNPKYYDQVFPISREAREELESAVISKLLETRDVSTEANQSIPF